MKKSWLVFILIQHLRWIFLFCIHIYDRSEQYFSIFFNNCSIFPIRCTFFLCNVISSSANLNNILNRINCSSRTSISWLKTWLNLVVSSNCWGRFWFLGLFWHQVWTSWTYYIHLYAPKKVTSIRMNPFFK